MKKFLYIVNNFTIASILPLLIFLFSTIYFFQTAAFLNTDFYNSLRDVFYEYSLFSIDGDREIVDRNAFDSYFTLEKIESITFDFISQLKTVLPENSLYEYDIELIESAYLLPDVIPSNFDFSINQPFVNLPLLTIINFLLLGFFFVILLVFVLSIVFSYFFSDRNSNFNSNFIKGPLFLSSVFSLLLFLFLNFNHRSFINASFSRLPVDFREAIIGLYQVTFYEIVFLCVLISFIFLLISTMSLLIGYFNRKSKYDAS